MATADTAIVDVRPKVDAPQTPQAEQQTSPAVDTSGDQAKKRGVSERRWFWQRDPDKAARKAIHKAQRTGRKGKPVEDEMRAMAGEDGTVTPSSSEATSLETPQAPAAPEQASSQAMDGAPEGATVKTAVPDQAPAAQVKTGESSQAISTASAASERVMAQLSDPNGLRIGDETFHIRIGETAVDAFRRGIVNLTTSKDPLLADQLRYAVLTAQAAGVSQDQLRIALDAACYPHVAEREPDVLSDTGQVLRQGKETKPADTGIAQELRNALGLPPELPQSPSEMSSEGRAEAAREREQVLAKILKANAESQQPRLVTDLVSEADIRAAAEGIINTGLQPRPGRKNNEQRMKEFKEIMTHRSAGELALIVANPGRFATEANLNLADLVNKKVAYTKGWRRLSLAKQAERRADEQFTALVATPDQIKQIEDRYKHLESVLVTFIKFLVGISLTTAFDIVQDEVGNAVMGQNT